MIAARLVGADAGLDRYPGGTQPRVALPGHFRIGIFQRRDDARDAGGNDGIGAGRRFAVMRARLKRDVKRRAARRVAGAAQSFDLGVRAAAGLRPAAPDDHAVVDDDRANRGIRPGAAETAAAQCQRQRHEPPVVGSVRALARRPVRRPRHLDTRLRIHLRAISAASSADSSASAVSKSLASRKLR